MDISSETQSSVKTQITILNNGGSANLVRLRSGETQQETDVEVTTTVSKVRQRRRRKDRRRQRWMRGQLMIGFGAIGARKTVTQRSGQLKLGARSAMAGFRRRDRNRGRPRSDRHRRSHTTIKGIPFNYYYTLNKMFNRLSVSTQRPFSDLKIRSVAVRDNGNALPLSVAGISTALVDMQYSQKDFVVAAKAVVVGDDIFVEPTKSQEDRVDVKKIAPGQALVMLEYLALTNRVAHVFTKGQISLEMYKKAIAACIASCQNLAVSAISLLDQKYERTMVNSSQQKSNSSLRSPGPRTAPTASNSAMKHSFGQMLSGVNASAVRTITTTGKHTSSVQESPTTISSASESSITSKAGPGAKKMTIAELTKRKK